MTRVRDFVVDLARSGKRCNEIKETVDSVYGDKSITKSQIYNILKQVKEGKNTDDQRRFNAKKTKRTPSLVAAVAADVDDDRRICVRTLALAHGVTKDTIFHILHDDLGLVKKSARWVPKLLNDEQKQERVRTCTEFLAMVQRRSLAMLDNIVTMDESAVSFHTPETKQQSKQWLKKGTPGPIKAKVSATRTKQMVLAFFDSKGLIYTNYVPRGTTVNAKYIVGALGRFLKIFRKKRPVMAQQEWFFHWDNAPVHTAAVVQDWIAARGVQMIRHPPYSPDLAPADFFLFPTVKKELAGRTLTPDTFKTSWEGAVRTIAKEGFATAFRRWYERCQKCVRIAGGYVEKT